ncbi:MAG: hypothetical protein J5858_09800 [Lentisphaeria bacterium]|nr:hypothetical protein [Lentisphaeria bacterium]
MLHKFLTAAAVLLTAISLYAQKPVTAAVTDIEDDPANGLEMCRSLFNEYFLSELTTHAKVNMLDTASVQKALSGLKISRGQALTEKQIQELCAKLKSDALCLVKMSRGKNSSIDISVKIVDKSGKEIGQTTASMKGIGDTDSASDAIAGICTKYLWKIRGIDEAESQKVEAQSKEKPLPSTVTEI